MQLSPLNENAIVITPDADFDRLTMMAEKTVSKSSAGVYKHTWATWYK